MFKRAALPLLLIAAALTLPATARALDLHKQYEDVLIRWGLAERGLERDPHPEGKILERIEIAREEIIAASDPWPNFINWFHLKTRDYIVRHELLVKPGDLWDRAKIDESARNLRRLFTLAVVRTVPCKSRVPGQVILLVVTKDLWSIRLNMNWSMIGSVVHFLDFQPTEMNFLGRNKRISLHLGFSEFDLKDLFGGETFKIQNRVTIGQSYVDNRILGSRWRLIEWFDLRLAGEVPCGGKNADGQPWCPTSSGGEIEGAYLQLRLTRPLFSLATKWSFDVYGVVDMTQVRSFQATAAGLQLKTADYLHPDGSIRSVPRVYDRQYLKGAAALTRSFGKTNKKNITLSMGAYQKRYTTPDNFIYDPLVLDRYSQGFLPYSEDALYVGASYHLYRAEYVKLKNIQSFALTEDFSLGHNIAMGTSFGVNLHDPSQSFAEGSLSLFYRWFFHDDLLTLQAASSLRYQPGLYRRGINTPWAIATISLGLNNVSPRVWWGRVHLNGWLDLTSNKLYQTHRLLGGDSGLRGYPSDHFEGQNATRINVEYRSLPINLFTMHMGFVLFYDGGAVFDGPDPRMPDQDLAFKYHHSVGCGVRAHFPQFDKESLRLDFGIPLSGDADSVGTWLSFSFRQVF